MMSGQFQFIISDGPVLPGDESTRSLIRSRASILGATDRRLRAKRHRGTRHHGIEDVLHKQIAGLDTSQSRLASNNVPRTVQVAVGTSTDDTDSTSTGEGGVVIFKTRLAPPIRVPSNITTPAYELARARYGACVTKLAVLAEWNLGQITIDALSAAPDRLISVLDDSRWSYLQFIPQYYGTDASLTAATDCVMYHMHRALVGNRGTRWTPMQSKLYRKALQELQSAIQDPVQCLSAEVLCASLLLCLYELLEPTSETSWNHHVTGSAKLIEHRGVQRFKDEFSHALFAANMAPTVANAVSVSTHTYLEEPEWLELYQSLIGSTVKHTIRSPTTLRIRSTMIVMPGIWVDITNAPKSPTFAIDDNTSLLRRCQEAHQDCMQGVDEYAQFSHLPLTDPERSVHREDVGLAMACGIMLKRYLGSLSHSTEQQRQLEQDAQQMALLLSDAQRLPPSKFSWLASGFEFGISMTVLMTGPMWLQDCELTGEERRLILLQRYEEWKGMLNITGNR